jgi:hypothetical protein
MLWNQYPKDLDHITLGEAYQTLQGDPPAKIPWIVWLLENPASPCALPGNIDLFGHDCIHLLLKKGFSSDDEAYVVGFTMGNDLRTNGLHLLVFKIFALFFYPPKYRMSYGQLSILHSGWNLGKKTKFKNLNQICLKDWSSKILHELRTELKLKIEA